MLDQELIEKIKKYPEENILFLIKEYKSQLTDGMDWQESDLETLMTAYALVSELNESNIIELQIEAIDFNCDHSNVCSQISRALNLIETQLKSKNNEVKFARLKNSFKLALNTGFFYEFTNGDIKTIQEIINDLRDRIAQESKLEEEHKSRLLKRLENLQQELHKKVSDLDKFWGLIGDAGVVLGKLGKDAKPIVDRIKEIANIVWRTQAHTEQLPSGTTPPLLQEQDE